MRSERRIEQEPPVASERESELWVGPTGNVSRDFASLRPFDLIKQRAAAIHRTGSPSDWTAALSIAPGSVGLKFRKLATVPLNGAHVKAAEVNSAGDVWIPAWLFIPDKPDLSRSPLLVLDDRGRNAHAHEDDLYHRIARSGRLVCAADIRGIGDTRPEVGRGNPGYTIPHDDEEEFAWASLILGNPLLAQRIVDILALVRALKNESASGDGRPIAVAARGQLTVPTLFACDRYKGIGSLHLAGGLVSFRNLLETEIYHQPLANFAWDLLRFTDLPLLAAQSAPRAIHLAGTVDGANIAMPVDQVRALYPAGHVRISSEPSWDEASLGSV